MLQIRRLKRSQINEKILNDVNRLWLQLSENGKPLTLAKLKGIARQKFYYLAVLKDRAAPAKIVAMGSIHFFMDFHGLTGYIGNVVVDKPYRHLGIGAQLEEYFTKLAMFKGAKFIDATSSEKHAPGFWLKHGWQQRNTSVFRKYLMSLNDLDY